MSKLFINGGVKNMNKHPEFLLNKIKSKDLKKLDLKELEQLASEIRTLILEKMLLKVAT